MKFIAILPILISAISAAATPTTLPCDKLGSAYKDVCEVIGDAAKPLLEKAAECDKKCSDLKCREECGKEVIESSPIGKRLKAIALCNHQNDASKLAKCAGLNDAQAKDFETCIKSAETTRDVQAGAKCTKKLFETTSDNDSSKDSEKKTSSSISISSSTLLLASILAIISFN